MTLALLASVIPEALADQCAWVDAPTAKAAASRLGKARSYRVWCEPCGEAAPGPAAQVRQVNVQPTGTGSFQVVVNGSEELDLAYTLVPDAGGRWVNLGLAVTCGAQDVSASWTEPGSDAKGSSAKAAPAKATAAASAKGIVSQQDEAGPGDSEASSANYAAVITTSCSRVTYLVNFASQGYQEVMGPYTVAAPGIYTTDGKKYDGSAGPLPRYFDSNQAVILHNGKSSIERVACVP
jgi:hypothetical protein